MSAATLSADLRGSRALWARPEQPRYVVRPAFAEHTEAQNNLPEAVLNVDRPLGQKYPFDGHGGKIKFGNRRVKAGPKFTEHVRVPRNVHDDEPLVIGPPVRADIEHCGFKEPRRHPEYVHQVRLRKAVPLVPAALGHFKPFSWVSERVLRPGHKIIVDGSCQPEVVARGLVDVMEGVEQFLEGGRNTMLHPGTGGALWPLSLMCSGPTGLSCSFTTADGLFCRARRGLAASLARLTRRVVYLAIAKGDV